MSITKEFKPNTKQEQFASLPDTVFEALYGGAAGGGKTQLLLMLPIMRGFYQASTFKAIFLRRTFPELEEVIARTHEWYKPFGAEYNVDKKLWKFPSGARVRFGHCEYESDIRKYDSDEYNLVMFDELTHFTEFQYNYLTGTRCRSSNKNLPAICRSGTNPGNVGHAWVRRYFVDPAPYGTIIGQKRTVTNRDGTEESKMMKRIFIQAFLSDNPAIDTNYKFALASLPEAERRAKADGDWDTFEGQVFDTYREVRLPHEPPNAVHIVQPFQIPDWWIKFLAVDWGYEAMTCALWGALSPDDKLYIYREYAIKHANTSTWASEIGELSKGEEFKDVVLCRSAWNQTGDTFTIEEKFTQYSGIRARKADNDRIAGKVALQEYLRWKVNPLPVIQDEYSHDTAMKILRNQGSKAYEAYAKSFNKKNETNLPKLQIFPDCLELRKAIPRCIYDKKNNVTGKSSEDVREFEGDDPYDSVRYLVCAVDRYLESQKDESDFRDKTNLVIQDFQKNRDWTAYHRRLEVLEAKKPSLQPVKRFHYAR